MATVAMERLFPTCAQLEPFHSYTLSESLVASIKATRVGERAVRVGTPTSEMARPVPICDHTVPFSSYIRSDALLSSMKATRFGEMGAMAGVPTGERLEANRTRLNS